MQRILGIIFLAACALILGGNAQQPAISAEKRLINDLLKRYEKLGVWGRPLRDNSKPRRVGFGVALIKLLDVNQESEVVKTLQWHRYRWTDDYLTWNPKQYSGVATVRLPSQKIWRPDIVAYQGMASNEALIDREAMAVVTNDGRVMWIPGYVASTACPMKSGEKEFKCKTKYGSWTYDAALLDIQLFDGLENYDTSEYIQSSQWSLNDTTASRVEKKYPCCQEIYPYLEFTFTLKKIKEAGEPRYDKLQVGTQKSQAVVDKMPGFMALAVAACLSLANLAR